MTGRLRMKVDYREGGFIIDDYPSEIRLVEALRCLIEAIKQVKEAKDAETRGFMQVACIIYGDVIHSISWSMMWCERNEDIKFIMNFACYYIHYVKELRG